MKYFSQTFADMKAYMKDVPFSSLWGTDNLRMVFLPPWLAVD